MDVPLEVVVAGREVTVCGLAPHTRMGELAALVGLPGGPALLVDGRVSPGACTLIDAGVSRGSTLDRWVSAEPGEPADSDGRGCEPAYEVVWRTGSCAGTVVALPEGAHVVGRTSAGSGWLVRALGSTQGVPGQVTARALHDGSTDGAAPFDLVPLASGLPMRRLPPEAEPAAVTRPGATSWTRAFNRPPRRPLPAAPEALRPPAAEAAAPRAPGATLVPTIVSAVGAAVAAVVLGQPLWLLLSGIGVVATLAARWQQRRRDRRSARATARRSAAAAADFAVAVADRHSEAAERAGAVADLTVAVRRAVGASSRLWERRPNHDDAFAVVLGVGDLPGSPTLEGGAPDAGGARVLGAHERLIGVPVPLAMGPGTVLGVVGSLRIGRSIARSIVSQLAVHHGPADLAVVALASTSAAPWAWLHWLPHARVPDDTLPLVAAGDADVDRLVADLAAARTDGAPPLTLLVVDDAQLLGPRTSGARAVLSGRAGPTAGVVLAASAEQLPACCTHVLTLAPGDAGAARLREVRTGDELGVLVAGADRPTATRVARALARFDDPDAAGVAGLPAAVSLGELLGPVAFDAGWLAASWAALGGDPPARAPVAVAGDGVVELDLERDGPHALVAGTTGAGKSELLRTWVAALAVRCRPSDVTFVLIDYKGGAAFDACAALPHVVGVVTDLDDALAERALCSLEAEVRRRERVLRAAGASDLTAYRRSAAPPEPLPRLVVVVDEFAALAAELPDFLAALVDVARRGRSLGIHLVLATQRPGGAVSDDVRANTSLRIALRVQDTGDALDVVGDPGAARLARDRPGRALFRLGPGEVLTVQTARCTVPARVESGVAVAYERSPVTQGPGQVEGPIRGARELLAAGSAAPAAVGGEVTELDLIVRATSGASARLGLAPPRRPWLPPLPSFLALPGSSGGCLGVIDDPARQRQTPLHWDRDAGNLLLVGASGTGAGAALAAALLDAAASTPPAALHMYVIDAAANCDLAALLALPHVGALVRVDEHERIERLVRRFHGELGARRAAAAASGGAPPVALVLAVDGLGSLRAALDDPRRPELLDALDAVVVDGPALSVHVVATVARPPAVPARLLGAFGPRWVFRLAEPGDAVHLGVAPPARASPAGRAVIAPSGLLAQVAAPAGRAELAAAVGAVAAGADPACASDRPVPVGVLPRMVPVGDLPASRRLGCSWHVSLGIGDVNLGPVEAALHAGDHLLVAGPARSGKTEALRLLAHGYGALHRCGPVPLLVVAPGARVPSGPWAPVDPAHLADAVPEAHRGPPPLLLVDDAERFDDDLGILGALAARRDLHLVVAGRTEILRTLYGHWTQHVRRQRSGVLLRPQAEADGDLLQVVLPRRVVREWPPGRGYLVADGVAQLVQLACTG